MLFSGDWRAFFRTIREGRFTSLGSYPKYWLTADGGTLSHKACRENALQIGRAMRAGPGNGSDVDQWRVIGCDINWEDQDMTCAHSGERIEPAYPADKESSNESV